MSIMGELVREPNTQRAVIQDTTATGALRGVTLKAFLDEHYGPWATVHHAAGRDIVTRINRFFGEFLSLSLSELTLRRIDRYRTEVLGRGQQQAAINEAVDGLRDLLSYAQDLGVIADDPLDGLIPLKTGKLPPVRFLTEEEEAALFSALTARDLELKFERARSNQRRKAQGRKLLPDLSRETFADHMLPMVILSLRAGLRQRELLELRWSDVDLNDRLLTIRSDDPKSGYTRYIPLNSSAQQTLMDWRIQCGLATGRVFADENGERLDDFQDAWSNLLRDAGIERFRWHDMRHHFAASLVTRGVPLHTVRELCGHADTNTTLRYAYLARRHKEGAVELLG